MIRDMDLIRSILLSVESDEEGDPIANIDIEGYSKKQIAYHVRLLCEAGLISCDIVDEDGPLLERPYLIFSLTWEGHEFIDASRDNNIWNKVKESIKEKTTSVSFQVLMTFLNAYASNLITSH